MRATLSPGRCQAPCEARPQPAGGRELTRGLPIVAAIFAGLAIGPAAGDDACRSRLERVPQPLWETRIVYEYLASLDEADCPKLEEAAFEAFVGPIEVNLVSYALLEGRLLAAGTPVRTELMETFVAEYRDAGLDLDENAVLPLIDIAYYECDGQAGCIGDTVRRFTQSASLTARAECLYAMPFVCGPAEIPADFFFLNDATLQNAPAPEAAFEKRAAFICGRYRDCGERTDGTGRR